jgi:cytochrome c oxidase assembly protein subunit 11
MTRMRPKRQDSQITTRGRDIAVAAACGAFVAGMVGLSYASVPLYDWFCRATGLNGTTQVATVGPAGVLDRSITVRFDANVGPGLPWKFQPERTAIKVKLGQVVTVHYTAINETARETTGTAAYNVAPLTVGAYFQKINCFCFEEQRLQPGERREMPVVFYVDPALAKDADDGDLDTITLSYTFYPTREPQRPVSGDKKLKTSGRL